LAAASSTAYKTGKAKGYVGANSGFNHAANGVTLYNAVGVAGNSGSLGKQQNTRVSIERI